MQSAFAALGYELVGDQIWSVPDEAVTFADLSPALRTRHEQRYVLIMQGDDWDHAQTCETVLVAPLSSQIDNQRAWESRIEPNETIGHSHPRAIGKPSLIKLQLMQPVNRRMILGQGALAGVVDPEKFGSIQLLLALNLSLPAQ